MKKRLLTNINYVLILTIMLLINSIYSTKLKLKSTQTNIEDYYLNDYYYSLPPVNQLSFQPIFNKEKINSSILNTGKTLPISPENVPKNYITPKIESKNYVPKISIANNSISSSSSSIKKLDDKEALPQTDPNTDTDSDSKIVQKFKANQKKIEKLLKNKNSKNNSEEFRKALEKSKNVLLKYNEKSFKKITQLTSHLSELNKLLKKEKEDNKDI